MRSGTYRNAAKGISQRENKVMGLIGPISVRCLALSACSEKSEKKVLKATRGLSMVEKLEFKKGDFVVYPAHGVGKIEGVDSFSVAGQDVMLYSISFEQDRMRLKVPVEKAKASGLRRLSSRDRIKEALTTLQGRSRVRRVMWSRRAQEYESKINSGDPVSIAEVVRDLHRGVDQPEQSYSERQIYQAALERLARELAAVEKIDQTKATIKLETVLTKEREKKAA